MAASSVGSVTLPSDRSFSRIGGEVNDRILEFLPQSTVLALASVSTDFSKRVDRPFYWQRVMNVRKNAGRVDLANNTLPARESYKVWVLYQGLIGHLDPFAETDHVLMMRALHTSPRLLQDPWFVKCRMGPFTTHPYYQAVIGEPLLQPDAKMLKEATKVGIRSVMQMLVPDPRYEDIRCRVLGLPPLENPFEEAYPKEDDSMDGLSLRARLREPKVVQDSLPMSLKTLLITPNWEFAVWAAKQCGQFAGDLESRRRIESGGRGLNMDKVVATLPTPTVDHLKVYINDILLRVLHGVRVQKKDGKCFSMLTLLKAGLMPDASWIPRISNAELSVFLQRWPRTTLPTSLLDQLESPDVFVEVYGKKQIYQQKLEDYLQRLQVLSGFARFKSKKDEMISRLFGIREVQDLFQPRPYKPPRFRGWRRDVREDHDPTELVTPLFREFAIAELQQAYYRDRGMVKERAEVIAHQGHRLAQMNPEERARFAAIGVFGLKPTP